MLEREDASVGDAREVMAEYAARLSAYKNKGKCGLPEFEWSGRKLERALEVLCEKMIDASGQVVVLIGAGVSTAAGVPDFRGPSGIWTKEAEHKSSKKRARGADAKDGEWVQHGTQGAAAAIDLGGLQPTLTHHALTELVRRGIVRCVVSQNIDGLEQRAGLPRAQLAVIHGCICEERCELCGVRYLRRSDVGGKSGAHTGRRCECAGCEGALGATLLDWEDEWPADQAALADGECDEAEFCLVLGSSLRVEPAGSLPNRSRSFALCNMQATPKDRASKCALIVRAKCDIVMAAIMRRVCQVEMVSAEEDGQVEWRQV